MFNKNFSLKSCFFLILCFFLSNAFTQSPQKNDPPSFSLSIKRGETKKLNVLFNNGDNYVFSYDKSGFVENQVQTNSFYLGVAENKNFLILSFYDNSVEMTIQKNGLLNIEKLHLEKDVNITTFGILKFSGPQIQAPKITIKAKDFHNKSTCLSRFCSFEVENAFFNRGNILSTEEIYISSKKFSNTRKISSTTIHIDASYYIENKGDLVAKKDLNITTKKIENKGFLHSDANQTIETISFRNYGTIETLGKGIYTASDMQNRSIMNINHGEIHVKELTNYHKGIITTNETLHLNIETSLVNRFGKIYTGGDLFINVLNGTFENIAGYTSANGNITLCANSFLNKRLPIQKKFGSNEYPSKQERVTWQGKYEQETSPPSLFISKNANIHLNVKNGLNEASLIHSAENSFIKANKFENLAHNLKNTTLYWDKGVHHGYRLGFKKRGKTVWNVESKTQYNHNAAAIVAGNGIFINIDGHSFQIKDKNNPYFSNFVNTGHIEAQKKIELSGNDGYSAFLNGLTNEKEATAIINPMDFTFPLTPPPLSYYEIEKDFLPMLNSMENKFYNFDEDNSNYLISSPSDDGEEIDLVTAAYTLQGAKIFPSSPPMLMSPSLQADSLQTNVFNLLGSPNIKGYHNGMEQLKDLFKQGYLYALINGQMQPIKGTLPSSKPTQKCELTNSQDLNLILEALINAMCQNNCISAAELKNRLCLSQQETHLAILTDEQIENAHLPFVVLSEVVYGGKKYFLTKAHISKDNFLQLHPEGSLIAHDGSIKSSVPYFKNTGHISATEIHILAHTFENEKRVTKHTENVRESGGWFHSSRTRSYEIRTPQPGATIQGLVIKITTQDFPNISSKDLKGGFLNKGGTIEAKHDIYILSKNGNVINTTQIATYVVQWDPGKLGEILGKSSSALAKSFVSGQILSSKGQVQLISETQRVVLEASKIIAKEDISLKSYLDTIIKGLHTKWVCLDKMDFSKFKLKSEKEEQINHQPSSLLSTNGNVNIESQNEVNIKDSKVYAATDVNIKSKNIALKAKNVKKEKKTRQIGFSNFEFSNVGTKIAQESTFQTEIVAGGNINLNAELNNFFEAVILTSGEGIHIVAGRDNLFAGIKQHSSINVSGFSLGISFFGSKAMEKILQDESVGDVLWELADETPIIQALHRLKEASDIADKTGETIYATLETLKLILATKKANKTLFGSFKGVIGEQLGITRMDANGKSVFDPNITFRIGYTNFNQKSVVTIPSSMNTKSFYSHSKGNTEWKDGTILYASNSAEIYTDKNLHMQARENDVSSSIQSCGASLSVGGTSGDLLAVGADYTKNNTGEKSYYNALIKTNHFRAKVKGNAVLEGVEIYSQKANIEIEKDLVFSSKQDTMSSSGRAGSLQIGLNGYLGGGYANNDINKKTTKVSKLEGESLNIDVKGNAYLKGSIIDGLDQSNFNAKEIFFENLTDKESSKGFSFNARLPVPGLNDNVSPIDYILGIADFNWKNNYKEMQAQSTISENVQIEAENDFSSLNRYLNNAYIDVSDNNFHFRLVLPVPDINKLKKEWRGLGKYNHKTIEIEDISPLVNEKSLEPIDNVFFTYEEINQETKIFVLLYPMDSNNYTTTYNTSILIDNESLPLEKWQTKKNSFLTNNTPSKMERIHLSTNFDGENLQIEHSGTIAYGEALKQFILPLQETIKLTNLDFLISQKIISYAFPSGAITFETNQQLSDSNQVQGMLTVSNQPIPTYSGIHQIDGEVLKDGSAITFINGMNNSFEEAKINAELLSNYAHGAKINYVYNASHGFIIDFLESSLGKLSIPNGASKKLNSLWTELLSNNSEGEILHFCHSQGAIQTQLALKNLPENLAKRINIVAIAPAAVLSQNDAKNYFSSDPVVLLNPLDFVVGYYKGNVFRLSSLENGFPDHTWSSQTYREKIKESLNNFINKHGGITK